VFQPRANQFTREVNCLEASVRTNPNKEMEPSPNLPQLPLEIVMIILEFTAINALDQQASSTVMNLQLVSRMTRSWLMPIIYHVFVIRLDTGSFNLFCNLIADPKLAPRPHIQHLVFENTSHSWLWLRAAIAPERSPIWKVESVAFSGVIDPAVLCSRANISTSRIVRLGQTGTELTVSRVPGDPSSLEQNITDIRCELSPDSDWLGIISQLLEEMPPDGWCLRLMLGPESGSAGQVVPFVALILRFLPEMHTILELDRTTSNQQPRQDWIAEFRDELLLDKDTTEIRSRIFVGKLPAPRNHTQYIRFLRRGEEVWQQGEPL
jgi:hypothetical protein